MMLVSDIYRDLLLLDTNMTLQRYVCSSSYHSSSPTHWFRFKHLDHGGIPLLSDCSTHPSSAPEQPIALCKDFFDR